MNYLTDMLFGLQLNNKTKPPNSVYTSDISSTPTRSKTNEAVLKVSSTNTLASPLFPSSESITSLIKLAVVENPDT